MRRRKLRWLLAIAIAAFASVATWLALSQREPVVQAKSSYLTAFINTYPAAASTKLNSCQLCHTSIPAKNAFGADYKSHGHNFQAIEALDSDGDGFSNLAEIQAGTWPGDPSDKPSAPTPTAVAPTPTPTTVPVPTPTPGSTPGGGQYRLIGWNDLGMHCLDDSFDVFSILPPYNTLWAQLIRVPEDGGLPEIVVDDVTVTYEFIDNTYSAGKINFWDHVKDLFGVDLAPDVGLTGAGLTGVMRAEEDHFVVEGVPLSPYTDSDPTTRNPYQLAHLVARRTSTGEILAETTFVAPVSDEMHCDNCHSDGQRERIATGNVRRNILVLHDKEEHTNLAASEPVLCASCHASPALGAPGKPGIPSLSLAMHRKHAPEHEGKEDDDRRDDQDHEKQRDEENRDHDKGRDDGEALRQDEEATLVRVVNWVRSAAPSSLGRDDGDDDEGEEGTNDCYQCHPGVETACLRGTMAASGLWCTDCHGDMNAMADPNRTPWVDLPKCADCHGSEHAENPGKLFRMSVGHGGVYCEACHGSPHAILPSTQPLDNMQVEQLQGYSGTLRECSVCHGANVPAQEGPHGLTAPALTIAPKAYVPLVRR